MIKGIIFDFDGPIMTSDKKTVFEKHALKHGLERDAIKNLIYGYFEQAFTGEFKTLEDFIVKVKPPLKITIQEANEALSEYHATKRIDPEMIQLILKLKGKYKVALLSNFTSDLDVFLKEVFNIYHLFDVVVNSYDIKIRKPEPGAFQYILDKMGLEPHETVFIDDRDDNVNAARRLGMKSIVHQSFAKCKKKLMQILKRDAN